MSSQYEYEKNDMEGKKKPSRKQKMSAGFLVVFGIGVLLFWIYQFNDRIRSPFAYTSNNPEACTGADCFADNPLTKDTDNDGITDMEETSIYQTSPYLEDSDSDGYSDWEEIQSGNDPNCPVGKDCSVQELIIPEDLASSIASSTESGLDEASLMQAISSESGSASQTITSVDANQIVNSIDPATLRSMLIEQGADQDVLDQISDDDLLNSFKEVYAEQAQ